MRTFANHGGTAEVGRDLSDCAAHSLEDTDRQELRTFKAFLSLSITFFYKLGAYQSLVAHEQQKDLTCVTKAALARKTHRKLAMSALQSSAAPSAPTHLPTRQPAATGLPMWKDTVLSVNASGREEAYSIGLDGYVWTYQIDRASGRTGRLLCTWLKASSFALAKSSSGRKLLIGGDDGSLYYVQEVGSASIWWTRPVPVVLPVAMTTAGGIDKVTARWIAGTLYVEVNVRHVGLSGETLLQTWESAWDCSGMAVQPSRWMLASTAISQPAALMSAPMECM